MRLTCPNCDAQYEVPDSAIPAGGRDVQCSNCGHFWYQMPIGPEDDEPEATLPDETAEAAIERALAGAPDPSDAKDPAPPVEAPAPEQPAPDQPEPDPVPAGTGPDDTASDDSAPAAPPPPRPKSLDESLVALLKEEADREMEARRAEARRQEVQMPETQGDLGLTAPDDSRDRARRLASLHGEDPDPAPARPTARRDLLPDVDSINSSLQTSEVENREAEAAADQPPQGATPSRGFRSGFSLVLLLAVAAVAAYVAAPQLAEQFPAAASTLQAYVQTVDNLRQWLDQVMISATSALSE